MKFTYCAVWGHRMSHRKWNNAVQPSAAHSAHFPCRVRHPCPHTVHVATSVSGDRTACLLRACLSPLRFVFFRGGVSLSALFHRPFIVTFPHFPEGGRERRREGGREGRAKWMTWHAHRTSQLLRSQSSAIWDYRVPRIIWHPWWLAKVSY